MFVLGCHITIDKFTFTSVHEVTVRRSLHNFTETATIKIPASARLKENGIRSATVETAKTIQAKMPVTIQLGYNGELKEEFKGFVSRVNFSTPVEIECEGYFQPLKFKTYTENFPSITLKGLLQHLVDAVPESGIVLSSNIPDANLGVFYCDNRNGSEILESLGQIE